MISCRSGCFLGFGRLVKVGIVPLLNPVIGERVLFVRRVCLISTHVRELICTEILSVEEHKDLCPHLVLTQYPPQVYIPYIY